MNSELSSRFVVVVVDVVGRCSPRASAGPSPPVRARSTGAPKQGGGPGGRGGVLRAEEEEEEEEERVDPRQGEGTVVLY